MMSNLGVHPGLVEHVDLIFAKAISQNIGRRKMPKKVSEKMVVYTCLTNGYDDLSSPIYKSPNVDYIVFTDNPNLQKEGWDTRYLENPLDLDARRLSRWPKILPHRFLPEYTHSIYIDANLAVLGDLSHLINEIQRTSLAVFEHPDGRKCLYEESDIVIQMGKDSADIVDNQMTHYAKHGFPRDYGMHECCILIRRHFDPLLMETMEIWWQELRQHSHRDQLSFSYARWRTGLEVNTIEGNVRYNNLVSKRSHKK